MNFAIPDFLPLLLALATLVGFVLATVAGIRRTWPAIDGWRTVVTVAIVALVLCVALVAWFTPALWWRGLIMGAIVALLSLGGDEYLKRIATKAGTTRRVEIVDSTIIPPAPRDATTTEPD